MTKTYSDIKRSTFGPNRIIDGGAIRWT
ncbi:hypothetical protein LCGC14_1829180, partial [marine sediment metagenome]